MTWWGWLLLAFSLKGYVSTWRRLAWHFATEFNRNPDGGDIAFGLLVGAVIALAWPLILPGYILWRTNLLFGPSKAFLKPPPHVVEEEKRYALQARIRELEREVGIRSG